MESDRMSNVNLPPNRSKFWPLKISLRWLLILVTIACVWLGRHVRRADQQRKAIDKVSTLGGWIRYDYQLQNGKFIPASDSKIPQYVRDIFGHDFFHSVVEVSFVYSDDSGTREDNENRSELSLEMLSGLPNLKRIYFCGEQINDRNIKHVSQLKNLERFYAWDAADLTDKGVTHLKPLRKLQDIHIGKSNLTDESLKTLSNIPNCKI